MRVKKQKRPDFLKVLTKKSSFFQKEKTLKY